MSLREWLELNMLNKISLLSWLNVILNLTTVVLLYLIYTKIDALAIHSQVQGATQQIAVVKG